MEKIISYIIIFGLAICSIEGKDLTIPAFSPFVGWVILVGLSAILLLEFRHWLGRRNDSENNSSDTSTE